VEDQGWRTFGGATGGGYGGEPRMATVIYSGRPRMAEVDLVTEQKSVYRVGVWSDFD